MKMANVLESDAEEVSDYMTAIWNNFDDGSKSLEYFGDVITNLGAHTASSAEEIAEGLGKFSAVADTVGLSYEYASASLATVVAETRQSADTVGTAFKTLFSRIQDLELGDEGSVSIGKYAEALQKVGIEILDAQGNMKQMDDILDEMGSKWDNLSQAQQTALAQNVAGTRQYTQLVALMNNWDEVKKNVDLAKESEGTLSTQQDIYMESTEAHLNSMTAAWENFYDSMLDTGTINTFADIIKDLGNSLALFADSTGGLIPLLLTLGATGIRTFSKQIGQSIAISANNLGLFEQETSNEIALSAKLANMFSGNWVGSFSSGAQANSIAMEESYASMIKFLSAMEQYKSVMSTSDWDSYNSVLEQGVKLGEIGHILETTTDAFKKLNEATKVFTVTPDSGILKQLQESDFTAVNTQIAAITDGLTQFKDAWQSGFKEKSGNVGHDDSSVYLAYLNELRTKLKNAGVDLTEFDKQCTTCFKTKTGQNRLKVTNDGLEMVRQNTTLSTEQMKEFDEYLNKTVGETTDQARSLSNLSSQYKALQESIRLTQESLQKRLDFTYNIANATKLVGSLGQVAMSISMLGNIMTTLKDKEKGVGEKFLSVITSIGFSLPMLVNSFKSSLNLIDDLTFSLRALGLSESALTEYTNAETVATELAAIAEKAKTASTAELNQLEKDQAIIKAKQALASKGFTLDKLKEIIAIKLGKSALCEATGQEEIETVAKINEAAATTLYTAAVVASIAAIVAMTYGLYKAYNAAADAAKEAKEAQQELTTAYEDAKSAYESLQSSFNEYSEASDALDELIEGTEEWSSAVQDLNNQILELLEKYPKLAEYINSNNGKLSISANNQEEFLKIQKQYLDNINQAELSASVYNNEAQNKSIEADITTGMIARYNQSSLATETGNVDQLATQQAEENFERLVKAYEEYGNAIFANTKELSIATGFTEEEIQVLGLNTDEIKNAVIQIGTNNKANDVMKVQQTMAYADTLGNTNYQESKYQEAIASAMYDSEEFKNAYNSWSRPNDKTMQKEYAEDLGYEWISNNNGTGTYQDADGNEHTISDETVEAYMRQKAALEAVGADIDTFTNTIENLANISEDASEELSNAFIKLQGGTDIVNLSDLSEAEAKAFSNANYSSLTSEEIQALGYNNLEDLQEAVSNSYTAYEAELKNFENPNTLHNNYLNGAIEGYNSLENKEDLTLNGRQDIMDSLEVAMVQGGEEGVQLLTSLYNEVPKEKAQEFVDVLNGFDFQSGTASDFRDALSDVGITTEYSNDQFQQLIDTLNTTSDTVETINSKYKQNNDIISKLKDGGSISAEDWEKLDSNYQTFFMKTLDGTYQLIGAAETLQKTLKKDYIQKNQDQINELYNQKNALAEYQNSNSGKDISKTAYTGDPIGNGRQAITENTELLTAQENLIKAVGIETEDDKNKFAKLQEQISEGGQTAINAYQEMADWAGQLATETENLDAAQGQLSQQIYDTELSILNSAESTKKLKELYEEGSYSIEAYNTALYNLDQQEDLAGLDTDELETYSNYLQDVLGLSEQVADVAAKTTLKMNTAIDTLADNFDDLTEKESKSDKNTNYWRDIIESSSKTSYEYAEAIQNTKEAVAQLLDISEEYVTADFIEKHLDEIGKAAQGSEEDIDNLKKSLSEEVVIPEIRASIDTSVLDEFDELTEKLRNNEYNIDINTNFNDEEVIQRFNEMIYQGKMTTDQVQAYFDSLGYEAEIDTTSVQIPRTQTKATTVGQVEYTGNGGYIRTETTTTEEEEIPGDTIGVASIGQAGKVSYPLIKSLTKKVNGSANNYSSSNAGGKTPGSSNKSASSGGSDNKDKDIKIYEEEFDIYHDLTRAIDELDNAMSDLEKEQDHLFGKELAKSLREENKLLEEQKGKYEELLQAEEDEAGTIAGQISAVSVALSGVAAEFDSTTGEIQNYAALTKAALQTYNDAVNALNAGTMTDNEFSKIENNYKNLKTYIENYDDTLDKITDTQDKLDDVYYDMLENNFKAWEAEISITLDLEKAKRDWKEFLNDINTDFTLNYEDTGASIKKDKDSFDSYTNDLNTNLQAIKDIEAEIDTMMAGGESSMFASVSEAQDSLYDYRDAFQEDAQQLYDLYQSIWDSYINGIEQAKDKLDDLIDKYDRINDDLDHQSKMIELIYGENSYDLLDQLYGAQSENQLGILDSLRQQVDLWKEQYDIAVATNGENSQDAQKAYEYWQDALSSLHDAEEKYLEDIQNQYKNTINSIFSELDKTLADNDGGLSWIKEQWDLEKASAEGYYDEVERIYNLETLRNKYENAISDDTDIKHQQELKTLMSQQLEMLENKEDLSEYDIELAEKRLEVAKAEMALEDAQNAKNSLRLSRDSQGNWVYEYTADQDEVNEKAQNLLDKQNEAYEYAKKSWTEIQSTIMETAQTAMEKIKEIELAKLSASETERNLLNQQEAYYKNYYASLLNQQLQQSNSMKNNLQVETGSSELGFTTANVDAYSLMTEQEKALVDELKNYSIQSSVDVYTATGTNLDMIYNYTAAVEEESITLWNSAAAQVINTWYNNEDSVKAMLIKAIDESKTSFTNYTSAVKAGCAAAGEDFTDVKKAIQADSEATTALGSLTEAVISVICTDLDAYRQSVEAVKTAWESMQDTIVNAGNTAIDYLQKEAEAASHLKDSLIEIKAAALEAAEALAAEEGAQKSLKDSYDPTYFDGASYVQGYGVNLTAGVSGLSEEALINIAKSMGIDTNKIYSYNKAATGLEVTSNTTSPLDSIAESLGEDTMIAARQGERVLSNDQTSAFDTLVYSVLPNLINSGILDTLSNLAKLDSTSVASTANTTSTVGDINNTYNIQADFSGVHDAQEIENAFLSLGNYASQYVWNK